VAQACAAGNVYVNRGITGARVGIEPFGGRKLSGTGPKTGGTEYLLAFLTRRDGYRADGAVSVGNDTSHAFPLRLQAWDAPPDHRLRVLREALAKLAADRDVLARAVTDWEGPSPDRAGRAAQDVLLPALAVLDHAPEVAALQPTVVIPGQDTSTIWSPRGVGIVAVDEGSQPDVLAGLLTGALAAGNGVIVAVGGKARGVAQALCEALWAAGVPRDVLATASPEESREGLVAQGLHFAAVDLSLESARSLARVLSRTDQSTGQTWLKALISMADGPRPAEAGFLRRLSLPKVVAVQTLRHGADLELT
jgi:delta 1-pyrroline-5-carboxylate dehydrogenase